jgi:DNA-binding transcriptional regulator LsrR (DeoR family)
VADVVTDDEREEMYERGVRAELCGVQLDAEGNPVTTSITDRLIGIDAAGLHAIPDVIALAYGTAKAEAVRAGLRGGFATSLVTHSSMARRLLDEN